ncbi:Methylamine utilization protein MauD [compost metagenome]
MDIFNISYVVLWIVVIIVAYGVVTVLNGAIKIRSTLYEQHEGLPQGVPFPLNGRVPFNDKPVGLTNHGKIATLVFLTSSGCLACKKLYPAINDLQKRMPLYQYLIMMSGTEEEVQVIMKDYEIKAPVIRVDNFKDLQTPFVPFGYYVSEDGIIRAKGIVNNEFHAQALISSGDRRIPA